MASVLFRIDRRCDLLEMSSVASVWNSQGGQFWYDGELVLADRLSLPIGDPALLYGATLFSTMRIYENSLNHPLTQWQAHCDRLRNSVVAFGWVEPDWQRIRSGTQLLLTDYPVLRLTLFADGREWITGRALPPDLAQRQTRGIIAWLADNVGIRSLPDHKTGNYLLPWLAQQQAQQQGAQEAILSDRQGHWLETATGNLWGWADGVWWTPMTDALPGLARSRLMSQLKNQGIEARETVWTADRVAGFETMAYSNCVVEVVPIRLIRSGIAEDLIYDSAHSAVQRLRSQFVGSELLIEPPGSQT
jgi:branched-subunit amino acid aminotransferase/4-amino-4-deoxychorismate lyase